MLPKYCWGSSDRHFNKSFTQSFFYSTNLEHLLNKEKFSKKMILWKNKELLAYAREKYVHRKLSSAFLNRTKKIETQTKSKVFI